MRLFSLAIPLSLLHLFFALSLEGQTPRPRETLAISAFGNNSGQPRYEYLGRALADMLTTDLSSSAAVRIVERDRLQELLKELQLSESRFIDPRTAQRVGRGLGATHVVVGSITVIEATVRLDARVVRTETSEVTLAKTVEGPLTRFLELEKELGRALLQNINVRLSQQEETAFQRPVTQSLEALEQYGQALIAKDRGEEVPARSYLEAAARIDPSFERARQLLDDLEADIRRVVTREYTDRAVTFLQRSLPEQARQAVDQAIRLNPRDGRAYFLRAVMSEGSERSREEILSDLDRAIANGQRTPKSYGARGRLRSTIGDEEGALRDYEAALRVRVDPTLILSRGFDYDEPLDGDETYGRQIFAIGTQLIRMGKPRRAQRACEVGYDAVGRARLWGADTADVRRILSQSDAPRSASERAAQSEWARDETTGRPEPDQSWTIFCIGWAIAAEAEESGDTALVPITSSVLSRFLDSCDGSNDYSCRFWPLRQYARGALYQLEVKRRVVLDSVIPMPAASSCEYLLSRIQREGRRLFPERWSEACLEELGDPRRKPRLTPEQTRRALTVARDAVTDGPSVPDAVLDQIVEVTQRFLPRNSLDTVPAPTKIGDEEGGSALEILDDLISEARRRGDREVTRSDVDALAQRILAIPAQNREFAKNARPGSNGGVVGLLASTPDSADGAIQYLDLLARRLTAVQWDETPTAVFEVGLRPLIVTLFERRRTQEGCKWYAALVERQISTAEVDLAAQSARCAIPRPSKGRQTVEYLSFSGDIPPAFRSIASPFFETLLAWLQGSSRSSEQDRASWIASNDSLEGMLALGDSAWDALRVMADSAREALRNRNSNLYEDPALETCRLVAIELRRSSQNFGYRMNEGTRRNAAEYGRFGIRVTRATASEIPTHGRAARCSLQQGFTEASNRILVFEGKILWPTKRQGEPYEIPFEVSLFRFGGKLHASVRFDE